MYEGLKGNQEPSPTKDKEPAKGVPFGETWALGIALSFSNLGTGVGAGLSNLPISLVTVTAFVANFILLFAGQWVASALRSSIQPCVVTLIAGLALLSLGVSVSTNAGESL